jgi:hypothetical protein
VTFYGDSSHFWGLPVQDWEPGQALKDPATHAFRIRMSWNEGDTRWTDKFAAFLDDPASQFAAGLVVGWWGTRSERGDSAPIVEAIVSAHARLPHLTALFLGDIASEENEISWILQSDVSPFFDAYPSLEHFQVRGGNGLSFGALRHDQLKSLTVETGGLPAEVVRQIAAADLPALEYLELWLGTTDYVDCATVDDLRPILCGERLPKLSYLGLCDSEIADEIALALEDAPIVGRLQTLDLSLGTLSDEGAQALLRAPLVRHLKKLDIHHHFCSPEMVFRLTGQMPDAEDAQPGLPDLDAGRREIGLFCVETNAADPQEAYEYVGDVYRYCAMRPRVEPPWVNF